MTLMLTSMHIDGVVGVILHTTMIFWVKVPAQQLKQT